MSLFLSSRCLSSDRTCASSVPLPALSRYSNLWLTGLMLKNLMRLLKGLSVKPALNFSWTPRLDEEVSAEVCEIIM